MDQDNKAGNSTKVEEGIPGKEWKPLLPDLKEDKVVFFCLYFQNKTRV